MVDVHDDRPRETDFTPADSTTRDPRSPKSDDAAGQAPVEIPATIPFNDYTCQTGHNRARPTPAEGGPGAQQEACVADGSPRLVDTDISTFFAGDQVKFNPLVGVMVCKPPNATSKSTWVLLEAKIQRTLEEFNPRSFHDALCIRPITDDLSNSDILDIENETVSTIVHLAMQALMKTSRIAGYAHVVVGNILLDPWPTTRLKAV